MATSPKAKGAFPENHELSLGVLGFAGCPQADAYFLAEENGEAEQQNGHEDVHEDVDVLLVVGSSLGELATHCWNPKLQPSKAMIHLDIDPTEIGKNYPVDVGMVGDAKTILTEMHFELERQLGRLEPSELPDLEARAQMVRDLKRKHPRFVEVEAFEDTSAPLKPQRLMRELEKAMPNDAILFVDIGNVMAWALHYFQVREPGTFHINLGLASMGHAVASSIGGKLAAPDRPVVALVGDAAFAMNGMEVHAAVEAQVPVVWVVMNNGGHGMVSHGERLQFKGKFQTGKFHTPLNIAKIAEGMGARSMRIEDPADFPEAFRQALASEELVVMDVLTDPAAMPPLGMRIQTLDKFFEAADSDADAAPAPAASHEPEVVITATEVPKPRQPRRGHAVTNNLQSSTSNGTQK